MKRKILSLLLSLLLVLCISLPAAAAEQPRYIIDGAELLTSDEEQILEEKALSLRADYKMDVVILTVPSLDGSTPQNYADDYFDDYGYGYGEDYSGILLLLSMEERDWYISTSGDAIYALTDYGTQSSMEIPLSYLGDGDYYGGFCAWLDGLPAYLNSSENGTPIDGYADYSGDYYHADNEETVYYGETSSPSIFLSLVIGVAAAAIVIVCMRFSMNTKRPQSGASNYLDEGSYHLYTRQDIFLYSNVSKVARPKENSSSGGGSSVHRSSSGRRHGGGGGKF